MTKRLTIILVALTPVLLVFLYTICSIRYTDGRQQRRCGHQTDNLTTHCTPLHNQALPC
ncbi:MAG TPA: hypothetical protein VH230_07205 [Stellaceae bacterium]|nr:hypothetical protein [Stellaceae bacterium]